MNFNRLTPFIKKSYLRPWNSLQCRYSSYNTGDIIHDYKVKRIADIPEFSMVATELEHTITGSPHLHVARDDQTNVFNVCLRTTPMNSTGVAHVLEHVALCGSNKFPVRDPFFKMLNRSMASFMNAMTGADYTMYPFSTQNQKDFRNLMSVYLDAVFFPRIRNMDFLQEGWRLENSETKNENSPITFKGVVYNEMKGLLADPSYLYGTALQNHLMPDHTYGYCSGGNPRSIPELTWQDLKDFHSTHYHPSNASFMTYGDIPLETHLEQINNDVMKKFQRIDPHTEVPSQPKWIESKRSEVFCPPDTMAANPDKQTTISFTYLLPEVSNIEECFTASVICKLLIDGPASPFYKALIESGLGSDYSPMTGNHNHNKDGMFSVGLQGVSADDVKKIEQIMEDTMKQVAEEGFDEDRIESLLHQVELSHKHQSSQFGLHVTFELHPVWQQGADPILSMKVDDIVQQFRENLKKDPKYLQKKCRQYFVDNKHRLLLTMSPDENFTSSFDKFEAGSLKKKIDSLTSSDKKIIFEQGLELAELQAKKEDLSCLPTLLVADIPKKNKNYDFTIDKYDGRSTIMLSPQPTNGVTYFDSVIPVNGLDEDLKPYLPIFCDILTQMGTKDTDYVTFSQKEQKYTGGLSASVASSACHKNPMNTETYMRLSSHCLDRNIKNMFDLWSELFNELNLSNTNRLQTLIRQQAQEFSNSVSYNGHMFAMKNAAQSLSPSSNYSEIFSGLSQVELLRNVAEIPDFSSVSEKLNRIANYVLRSSNSTTLDVPRYLLHATPATIQSAHVSLQKFMKGLPISEDIDQCQNHLLQNGNVEYTNTECFRSLINWKQFENNISSLHRNHHELPLPVNFVSMCLRTPVSYSHNDSASLRVLARLLTFKFLHKEIREKGGAYGGGAKHGDDGLFRFYSYRDPNNEKTIEAFQQGAMWATTGDFSQQDIDESKIAMFQQIDAPVSPCNRGSAYFFNALDDKTRQKIRDRILAVTKDDLIKSANLYLAKPISSSISVLGPKEKRQQVKESC